MRQNYDILKERYPSATIVPGFIRSDVALSNGTGRTLFPVKKGDKVAFSCENLLDYKDAFAITRYGIQIINEVVGNEGVGVRQTYPNIIVFPATDTGLVAEDLEKIYNGTLAIKVGQDQLIEAYPTANFRVVRTSQQAAATTRSEALPVDGFASAEPLVILRGNDKIEVVLQRPAKSGEGVQLTTTTSKIVKAVFFAQGFTIYGAGGQ